MAQTIKSNNDICIKIGDPITFTVSTEGDVKAVVGEDAKFMIKRNPNDADVDAVYSQDITVIVDNEIGVYVPSLSTKNLPVGTFYWSMKHTKGSDTYTIIPDDGCEQYPLFSIKGVLIYG